MIRHDRFAYAFITCAAILAPCLSGASLSAQEAPAVAKAAGLSPLDYPRAAASRDSLAKSAVPPPIDRPAAARITAPSPLLGLKPPLPLSLPMAQHVRQNPSLLEKMQSTLKPVSSSPAPPPPPFTEPKGLPPRPLSQNATTPPVGGSWVLGPTPPGAPLLSNPLLLTDGTVIAHVSCTGTWWKLTPDVNGSYINGSWSQIASMPAGYAPRFFSSAVLPDGRVIVEGGEYNTGCTAVWTNLGAIYNPLDNTWTSVTPPAGWGYIGDAQSAVLANGTYMQASSLTTQSALFNPLTLGWTATGAGKFDANDEEGWTLLPDGTVLTVDAYVYTGTCGTNSERYNPSTGAWTSAGSTGANHLADCTNGFSFEIGPQVLRPDGTVVAFGGTTGSGVITPTAIYKSTTHAWSAGPNIPAVSGTNYTLADAPAVQLPNGNVLFAASPKPSVFSPPTHFFEMSPATSGNTITQVAEPTDAAFFTSFQWNFVILGNGQIMALETDGSNVWIYVPAAGQTASAAPTITSAPANVVPGATYTLAGTQLNGLSQGASYGDDEQASTNYPIIVIRNANTGHWYFNRTFNPSSMSVAPGAAGTVSFTVPEGIEAGPNYIYVGANGNYSSGAPINVVRSGYAKYLDFNGDGKSDLLWRDSNDGAVSIWEMSGGAILASASWGVSKEWTIAGASDFNGDGKSDILWRDINGMVSIWQMNGLTIQSILGPWPVSNTWTIVGTGDFNGDGKSDILWRNNSDGSVAIWEMSGGTILASASVGSAILDWTIAGVGDFNGDGKSDILWRKADGSVAIWLMNGFSVSSGFAFATVAANWFVAGVGDFNRDRKSDILWRDSKTGAVMIWEMNGGTVLSEFIAGSAPLNWTIVGTGDFFGDGNADIVWRDSTAGTVSIWEMRNGIYLASVGNQSVALKWGLDQ